MLATLIDGRQVDSAGEEWRAECEARAVCRMVGHWENDERGRRHWVDPRVVRRKYLASVESRRGKVLADMLRRHVEAVWKHEQKLKASECGDSITRVTGG